MAAKYLNIYVDVPPSSLDPESPWVKVKELQNATKEEAVAWIREHIGQCNGNGEISLLTLGEEEADVSGVERPPGLPTSPPPPRVDNKPRIEKMRKCLFELRDEIDFKRSFAIQWLAAIEAVNYQRNCSLGWSGHKPPVEDAGSLADRAWQAWIEEVGLGEVEANQ